MHVTSAIIEEFTQGKRGNACKPNRYLARTYSEYGALPVYLGYTFVDSIGVEEISSQKPLFLGRQYFHSFPHFISFFSVVAVPHSLLLSLLQELYAYFTYFSILILFSILPLLSPRYSSEYKSYVCLKLFKEQRNSQRLLQVAYNKAKRDKRTFF